MPGPGVRAAQVLEDAEPVLEVEYRYGCLWSEVAYLLDFDPSRKDLSAQIGLVSLKGADVTSRTPMKRETPVR